MKFALGFLVGATATAWTTWTAATYSYLPEIFVIERSEERGGHVLFLDKQFTAAMKAQRQRLYDEGILHD
jgi:hypothetical protein